MKICRYSFWKFLFTYLFICIGFWLALCILVKEAFGQFYSTLRVSAAIQAVLLGLGKKQFQLRGAFRCCQHQCYARVDVKVD